ncbi:hypothetical protein L3X38_020159 [Prunus dulcis]|uniref:Uncharacterized protein n=1 Tax=Prunus dulcis TaxID=3755 RepID=A0AAD4ZCE9_PRUDU|nr:hypothetical protein L3X38_020159 [Prunus dulcis]
MLVVVLRAYGKLKELMNSRLTEEAADQQNGLYPDFYHIHVYILAKVGTVYICSPSCPFMYRPSWRKRRIGYLNVTKVRDVRILLVLVTQVSTFVLFD